MVIAGFQIGWQIQRELVTPSAIIWNARQLCFGAQHFAVAPAKPPDESGIRQRASVLRIIDDMGDRMDRRAGIDLRGPEFPTEQDGLIGDGELLHGRLLLHLIERSDPGPILEQDSEWHDAGEAWVDWTQAPKGFGRLLDDE